MVHISAVSPFKRKDDPAWRPVASDLTTVVNNMANTSHIIAYVGEDGGRGEAPAMYIPALAEIELNSTAAFGELKPATIGDLTDRSNQVLHAKAIGAVWHEAMHIRFSPVKMPMADQLDPYEWDALSLLEESRIEALGLKDQPHNRSFIRAAVLSIILGDLKDARLAKQTQTRQVAHLMGISLARVDAGSIEAEDIKHIREQIEKVFDASTIEKFRKIWLDFQRCGNASFYESKMCDLAIEWNRLVKDESSKRNEPAEAEDGSGVVIYVDGPAPEGAGESGEASGETPSITVIFSEAAKKDQEKTESSAVNEATRQVAQEQKDQAQKEADLERKQQDQNNASAHSVFGDRQSTGVAPGNSRGATRSKLVSSRAPSSAERASAVTISQLLERAKYRDREATKTVSAVPPGRLRTSAALQGRAQVAQGGRNTTEPWRRVMRKQTEEPKLSVGMMVDISGSMRSAMEPMGVSAWIMSEAVRRVFGTAAMVYYGASVFATLKPGQHLDQVKIYSAADGAHEFNEGFKALDGALKLLQGSGARLLVICSDGQYGGAEISAVTKWLNKCQQAGVGVLWLGMKDCSNSMAMSFCDNSDAEFVQVEGSVTEAASAIGKAAEKALTRAGARRG